MNQSVPLFLYWGADEYRIGEAARQCIDTLLPPAEQALRLDICDAKADNAAQAEAAVTRCLQALQTVSLWSGNKVVWMRGVNFLADSPASRSDAVKNRLKQVLSVIQENRTAQATLIVTAGEVDRRSSFYKGCCEAGTVEEYALPDKAREADRQALERVDAEFEAAGLRAAEEVKIRFRDKVGTDTRQIANEAAKLALYLGDRQEVSAEDIRAIISPTRDSAIWDLTEAFGNRHLSKALQCARQLLFQKEDPLRLIALLQNRLKLWLAMAEAVAHGWIHLRGERNPCWAEMPPDVYTALSATVGRDLRQMHSFFLANLVAQAGRFSREELRRAQRLTLAAHEQLVTSNVPPTLILEVLLIRCLQREALTAAPLLR
jgi:DNA polymerase-3 subunit delta